MKKIKSILISTLLVFTLCMLTACGKDNNAADEVPNATTDDNTDNVGDGTAEDNLTDDADIMRTMMKTTEQPELWPLMRSAG